MPLFYFLAFAPMLAGTIMLMRHPKAPKASKSPRRQKLGTA